MKFYVYQPQTPLHIQGSQPGFLSCGLPVPESKTILPELTVLQDPLNFQVCEECAKQNPNHQEVN